MTKTYLTAGQLTVLAFIGSRDKTIGVPTYSLVSRDLTYDAELTDLENKNLIVTTKQNIKGTNLNYTSLTEKGSKLVNDLLIHAYANLDY